jgi:hypothetical protein
MRALLHALKQVLRLLGVGSLALYEGFHSVSGIDWVLMVMAEVQLHLVRRLLRLALNEVGRCVCLTDQETCRLRLVAVPSCDVMGNLTRETS